MILRPVRPQSPMGPPMTNLPVGLTSVMSSSLLDVVQVLGQDGLDDVLEEVGLDDALHVGVSACCVASTTLAISTGLPPS